MAKTGFLFVVLLRLAFYRTGFSCAVFLLVLALVEDKPCPRITVCFRHSTLKLRELRISFSPGVSVEELVKGGRRSSFPLSGSKLSKVLTVYILICLLKVAASPWAFRSEPLPCRGAEVGSLRHLREH
jgi:hypothetical protein